MPTLIDLSALGARGVTIIGDATFDHAGWSVANAGDVNGDGLDDIIIGAPFNDVGGNTAGRAYVIYGRPGGLNTIDLGNLQASDGFLIQGGSAYDYAGITVAGAGDINGDGFDDLIVGSVVGYYFYYGGTPRAHVIFGSASPQEVNLGTVAASAGFVIEGTTTYGAASFHVSEAGDINGDGFDDIVIGVPTDDSDAGAAYVIFGKASGFGTIDLANLASAAGFAILGDADGDALGRSVSAAGDVNGDGFGDLIVGAPSSDDGVVNVGEAYVIFGKASGFATIDLANLAPAAGFIIRGDVGGDEAGFSVSGAGDVNDDGFDDLIVGAPFGDNGGNSAGEAYVIFGRAGGFSTIDLTNLGTNGFIIQGDVASDNAGFSVSAAGDVNGDGFADVLVGAPFGDDGGAQAGEAYVIFGRANGFGTIDLTNLAPSDGFIIQGNAAEDNAGIDVSAAGDVNNDGFDDILVAASRGDLGGDRAGQVYIIFGRPDNVRNDVNGDGRSDILWRHEDGTIANWLGTANGGFAPNNSSVANAPDYWQVVGTGDFNGDGRDDLLWRGAAGELGNWLAAPSGAFAYNAAVGIVNVPSNWHVEGVGDFNGDGFDDVLWRNDAGDIGNWLGSVSGAVSYNAAAGVVAVDNYWQIAGVGDFNGDGRDDILWRGGGGEVGSWLGNASGGFAYNAAAGVAAAPASWNVVGIGDFSGDGHDDIVWRSNIGEVGTWLANPNGSFTANNAQVVMVATAWHIADVGDFNGDNVDDLLWRHDNGQMTDWLGGSSGAFVDNNAAALTHVPTNWSIQAPDLNWV